jgi:hypothetical protein
MTRVCIQSKNHSSFTFDICIHSQNTKVTTLLIHQSSRHTRDVLDCSAYLHPNSLDILTQWLLQLWRAHECVHRSIVQQGGLTHTCTHARTHARTHTRTHTRTHARTHARTHTRTHTRTHARTHSRKHTRTHALTHAHTHARTHARTHALTHARTHARTHSRTHLPVRLHSAQKHR